MTRMRHLCIVLGLVLTTSTLLATNAPATQIPGYVEIYPFSAWYGSGGGLIDPYPLFYGTPGNVTGEYFSYVGNVPDLSFTTQGTCYPVEIPFCLIYWFGTIVSGPIQITGPVAFSGNILGGWLSGSYWSIAGGPQAYTFEEDSFTFSGTWSNGWKSTGNFDNSMVNERDLGVGHMSFTSTTPEPGSVALALSGLAPLAYALRRKL